MEKPALLIMEYLTSDLRISVLRTVSLFISLHTEAATTTAVWQAAGVFLFFSSFS